MSHDARDTICLVTCGKVPLLTADDRLLQQALVADGWAVEIAKWDDPEVDWASYRAAIVRSTWDYHLRSAEFERWLARCETLGARLLNPARLIRWNVHKSYLTELADAGLSIVPTRVVRRGEACDLARLLAERGWSEVVVKPAISATAHRTFRASRESAAEDGAKLQAYLRETDFLIQPFVREIATAGEISFVFFAGQLSHATLKRARPGDFRVQSDFGGSLSLYDPDNGLVAQAHRVAAAIRQPWLYARIDAIDRGGELVVMEVELIEPQLFLGERPGAATAMVTAFRRMVEEPDPP